MRIVRQSPWRLTSSAAPPAILIILTFLLFFPLFARGKAGISLFFAALIIGAVWLGRNFIIWKMSTLLITNQRIIDADQQGLFRKTVSDVPLSKIQDVFYRVNGLQQTVSRVGNVKIILNDQKTAIEAKNINQPAAIQQLILQLRSETLHDRLDTTNLSAQELIELVKKIKAGLGEEKFKKVLEAQD